MLQERWIVLVGCCGGPDTFLLAARFSYGYRVERTPKNIIAVYSAAEYVEMMEAYGEENLLAKAEASKAGKIAYWLFKTWSILFQSLQSPGRSILWNGINTGARIRSSLSDWWFEYVPCLGMLMFKRPIETMKVRGIRSANTAGALTYYVRKYLPGQDRWQSGQCA